MYFMGIEDILQGFENQVIMSEGRVEAITLQTLPYRERERIIKFFSKEEGLLSIIVKGISPKKPDILALSSPLILVRLVYRKKSGDLHLLTDVKIETSFMKIRKDLTTLNAACEMTKAVRSSQLPHKASPQLYALFKTYLERISSFENPQILTSSFLLKLLMHDGHLHLQSTCQKCNGKALFLEKGESLCLKHKDPFSISFTDREWKDLLLLTYSKKFSELQKIELSSIDKVLDLYKTTLESIR